MLAPQKGATMGVSIKSMQLYTGAARILSELRALGIRDDQPVDLATLSQFDQLHYHGTEALDVAIDACAIDARAEVLEIGSGWGGPARYVADKSGGHVTAVELQEDYHSVGELLSARTPLSGTVEHICGDFHALALQPEAYSHVVSWLALYHIPGRPSFLQKSFNLLKPGGYFWTEDLYLRAPIPENEQSALDSALFAKSLVSLEGYGATLREAGFDDVSCQDMSADWSAFTAARLADFTAGKDAYIARHDAETYGAMESFYTVISGYFARGIIGGVRAKARRS